MFFFRRITDLDRQRAELVAGRYGVIDVIDGKLAQITLRPWPKFVSLWESLGWGEYLHRYRPGDRCRLFYNQPRGSERFLAFKYFLTTRGTSLRSFHTALDTLDEIARIKRSDAIVCEAANLRLNERIMRRYGWEQHTNKPRNYIKRFYGRYPVKEVLTAISSRAELVIRIPNNNSALSTLFAVSETTNGSAGASPSQKLTAFPTALFLARKRLTS